MPIDEVVLSEEHRIELRSVAQSRSLSAGYVFRVRLILMLAEGVSHSLIQRQLRTTAPTIVGRLDLFVRAPDWTPVIPVNRPTC